MASQKQDTRITITTRSFAAALALVLVTGLLPMVATFIGLIMLALIMSAALVPVVATVRAKLKLSHESAVTWVFVGMLTLAAVACFLIVPTVLDQAQMLAANMPRYVEHLQGTATWIQQQAVRLGAKLPMVPDFKGMAAAVSSNASGWVGSSLGMAGKALSLAAMGLLVLMLAFFVLLEAPSLRPAALSLVPPPQRKLIDAQIDPIIEKLAGYVQGTLLGIALLAVYQVLVLTCLGLPLAIALGLLSALFAVLPMVGGFLGIIPPALVALSVSWKAAVWALVLGYLGHFVAANFVMPIVFARSVKLSPLMVTIALLVGSEAAGIFGALVAVPVAAALQVLVQNLYVAIQEELHRPEERDGLRFEHAPLPRLANVDLTQP